jgi:hypothetical protein
LKIAICFAASSLKNHSSRRSHSANSASLMTTPGIVR